MPCRVEHSGCCFIAIYGVTEAAVFRFVGSVNIELEKAGTANRILNVCPGSIRSTSFYEASTDAGGTKRPDACDGGQDDSPGNAAYFAL